MDPDETLAALREALDKTDDDFVIEDVQELFSALDEWITKGGFLPSAWVGAENERVLQVVRDWKDEEFELAFGFPRTPIDKED